jgi:hypothetical protein
MGSERAVEKIDGDSIEELRAMHPVAGAAAMAVAIVTFPILWLALAVGSREAEGDAEKATTQ